MSCVQWLREVLVRPPTESFRISLMEKTRWPRSVDHLLELLHRKSTNSLGRRLGLDARLLCERVDTLTSSLSWLLLELQVEGTSQFEAAILLELACSNLDKTFNHSLHLLRLEASGLGNGAVSSRGGHDGGLHGLLHALHGGHGCKGDFLRRKFCGRKREPNNTTPCKALSLELLSF